MVTLYFGLPGCGKTTILTAIAQKELRKIKKGRSKYKRVFCNFYCSGTFKFDYLKDFGKFDMSDSLILIDEASLEQDSRDFKTFTFDKKQGFLLHRHFCQDIVLATQQYNGVDLKIRNIVSRLFYVNKIFCFSKIVEIPPKIVFPKDTGEIVQGYVKPSFFQRLGTTKIYFRPFFYKFFNTLDRPKLPEKEWLVFD